MSSVPSCRGAVSVGDVNGRAWMCELGAGVLGRISPDGTHRAQARGQVVGGMSYLGTFVPYITVLTDALVKIDKDIPQKSAALIGCGRPTGWGSAVYAADMELNDIVVVIGTAGVGMRGTGSPYRNTYITNLVVRDGLIVELAEYLDPISLVTALGGRATPPGSAA